MRGDERRRRSDATNDNMQVMKVMKVYDAQDMGDGEGRRELTSAAVLTKQSNKRRVRDLNHALTQSVVWSYGFLYLHCKPCRYDHNTQATHGTQRIAAHGTQRMARNARQHKIQSLACSTTITLHPLLAGMMKTCSIVHITSISSHKHLYPLSSLFTYPFSSSSFDLLMSSCTTIHHSEWGRVHKHSCLMSCNLCIPLHLICILSPILPLTCCFVNMTSSVTPIKCNE